MDTAAWQEAQRTVRGGRGGWGGTKELWQWREDSRANPIKLHAWLHTPPIPSLLLFLLGASFALLHLLSTPLWLSLSLQSWLSLTTPTHSPFTFFYIPPLCMCVCLSLSQNTLPTPLSSFPHPLLSLIILPHSLLKLYQCVHVHVRIRTTRSGHKLRQTQQNRFNRLKLDLLAKTPQQK